MWITAYEDACIGLLNWCEATRLFDADACELTIADRMVV